MNKHTDLVLVTFFDDQEEGQTFIRSRHNGWPLHVTLFPWFGVADFDTLSDRLTDLAKRHSSFRVRVDAEKMFGIDEDIPVNVIHDQTQIKHLHEDIRALILPAGKILEPRWIGDNYNAHITQHEGDDAVAVGDELSIDHMYLVRMLDDDRCLFLKKYSFGRF